MHSLTPARLRGRPRRTLLAAALPAALAAAALPTTAQAASVSENVVNGARTVMVLDRGFFVGGSAEDNNMSVAVEGDFLVIRDFAGITTDSSRGECFTVSAIEAHCPRSVRAVEVRLGGGADMIEYRAPHKGFVDLGAENDIVGGGRRIASGLLVEDVVYRGGDGFDTVSYVRADRGVRVDTADGLATDGRPGIDEENVASDVEIIEGSNFADVLFGSTADDILRGLAGDDLIAGGAGADTINEGTAANGADTINGGDGANDRVFYSLRTSGVDVSLDGVRNDGARTGERDDVRPSIEHIDGTDFEDTLTGNGSANTITGSGGQDTIKGLGGPDTLAVGAKANAVFGGTGNDVIEARNNEIDNIDCGESPNDSDTANRDTTENIVVGCERGKVGALRLAPKATDAEAGQTVRVRLSWRHPQAWKQLSKIELRLTRDRMPVGEVTIRPGTGGIGADGAVKLLRKRSRLTHKGKTVTARLALRLDESLAGQTLKAEVEATDRRGRRQLERDAGRIRVSS